MTDTMGVDFCPYLNGGVIPKIRSTWYKLMPNEVFAPILKHGHVIIEFSIYQDGSVQEMKVNSASGDLALDGAAFQAIATSSPLEPLPPQYTKPKIALRFHFYYNSGPGSDLPARNGALRAGGPVVAPILVRPKAAHYPKSARKSGREGTVWVSLIVGTNGKPRDTIVINGVSPELDEEAIKTVGKWRFRPGTLNGEPVAVEVSEEVTFKLN